VKITRAWARSELIVHRNAIEVALQALVFLAHAQQYEVVRKKVRDAAAPRFHHARERRYAGNGPHADQPDFAVGFDLVGEQDQLGQDRQQQNRQVAIAI
jgi:hypothetical protein